MSVKLTETAYLFFRIACHSLWPISHFYTIPLQQCVFLYAFVSGASIIFSHLFLRSLNKVHRSSTVGHALIHPIFIHRILLFLGLAVFPSGEPVHVVALIGATFLRQRTAHLRVDPTRPRGVSSGVVPHPSSSTGTDAAEASSAAIADADVPPNRSSAVGHALIHPIFIHRILLFLGLAIFPSGEPVHVVTPIGATFLRQRAAHLRVDPTRPKGASSGVVPPPPSSTGADAAKASSVAAIDADVPPPTTSNDLDIRCTLDHVLSVQATHGQILVDVLDEIRALRIELAQFQRFSLPPPFDDGF